MHTGASSVRREKQIPHIRLKVRRTGDPETWDVIRVGQGVLQEPGRQLEATAEPPDSWPHLVR